MNIRQLIAWLALTLVLTACGTTKASTVAFAPAPAATDLLIHDVSTREVVDTAKRELDSDIAVIYVRKGEAFTCGTATFTGITSDPRLCLSPKTVVIPEASAETFSDASPAFIRYVIALQVATTKVELRASAACMAGYVAKKAPGSTAGDQQALESEVFKRSGKFLSDAAKTGVIYADHGLSPMLCVANSSDPSSIARKTN